MRENPVTIKLPKNHSAEGCHGLIGVSLDDRSPYSESTETVKNLITAATSNFETCAVLLADGALRLLSLQAQEPDTNIGLLEDRANAEGDKWLEKFGVSKFLRPQDGILHWHEVEALSSFEEMREGVNNLYETDAHFKTAVAKMASMYQRRLNTNQTPLSDSASASLRFCERYILLELAGLAALGKENKIHYFLYPGKQTEAMHLMKDHWFKHLDGGACEEFLHWGRIVIPTSPKLSPVTNCRLFALPPHSPELNPNLLEAAEGAETTYSLPPDLVKHLTPLLSNLVQEEVNKRLATNQTLVGKQPTGYNALFVMLVAALVFALATREFTFGAINTFRP